MITTHVTALTATTCAGSRRGPGDFFGELTILTVGGQRNATIIATSPVRILTLTAHYMREVRERMPSVGEKIEGMIAARTH
jgi:CRP-like cAMP-binding protein